MPRSATLEALQSTSSLSTEVGDINTESMIDSDEVPYSDSDTEPDRTNSQSITEGQSKTMPRAIGTMKLQGYTSDTGPERSSSAQDSFPRPPPRKGPAIVTQHEKQAKQQSGPEPKHAIGGLTHSRSTVWMRKKSQSGQESRRTDDEDSLSITSNSAYRRAGLRSNLSEWAPSAKPPAGSWAGITNLPDWNTLRAGEPTSRPITHVQRDLDWSTRRLLNENIFEKLINDQLGRHRFREFLFHNTGSENKVDMFFDLGQYFKQSEAVRQASEAIHDIYLAHDSHGHVDLPEEMGDDLYGMLKRQYEVKASLLPIQQHLLQSLYKTEFQLFVKSRLVEYNKVKLGSFTDQQVDQSGLGDCFCLTNPRLRENPIVLVSPGFESVTGYPRHQIIGRNCRFLQGPGTAPDSVQRIRDALNAGEPCTELLLNYCQDGTPFFCLLTIIPLRDATGTLVYFIGGQTNVTGQLSSAKGLNFLVGGGTKESTYKGSTVNGFEVSPSLSRYMKSGAITDGTGVDHDSSLISLKNGSVRSSQTKRSVAAGSYDPNSQTGPINASSSASDMLSPIPTSYKKSGAMSRLFAPLSRKDRSNYASYESTQRLVGAEGAMRKDPFSLQDQMEYFTALYSKVIIFKRTKREIIFATRECIAFFELPVNTWKDVYASPLVHADLLSIVQGSDKEETRTVQHSIQVAVRNGESISVRTGIKRVRTKKTFLGTISSTPDWVPNKDVPKYTTIHITPLRDRDNSSFAFVALVA